MVQEGIINVKYYVLKVFLQQLMSVFVFPNLGVAGNYQTAAASQPLKESE